MNANTRTAARPRPEPVARQHHPRHARRRHARALHRRVLGHRADVEPDDLRARDRQAAAPTTRRSPSWRAAGRSGEELFFELALEDLRRAADLFRPIHDATGGVDGWVSLEVSPLLVDDTAGSDRGGARSCTRRRRGPTSSSRSRARRQASPAIEESIFAGVPINVTLLFSREQYLAVGRGVPARHRAAHRGRAATRTSSRSRRCSSAAGTWRSTTRCRPSCATGSASRSRERTYQAYRELLASPRWQQARRRRRASAAPALGEHRHQGPGRARHALRRSARRARHDRHHPGQDAARASPTTASSARRWPTTAATPRRCSPRFARARRRRRRARRASCRRKAPRRSSKSWNDLLERIADKSRS